MFRETEHIGARGSELRGEPELGVDLMIEESGGDGGAGAKGKQHNEKATGVRAEETADNAPEHGPIGCARVGHHSPRKIGAGSMRDARRSGRALPRIVTPVASAMTTKKTITEGSGAAPKIFSPTKRAKTIPSA